MLPESEERLQRQISELCRSMERGFERVHEDVDELRRDVKAIHLDAIPHRVRALETWKDGMSARMWTFLLGCGVALIGAWTAFLLR